VRVWRIASAAHAAFDGEGPRLYGGRWTPRGVRAVYTSATLSLAALERFVNTDPDLDPANLIAIAADLKAGLAIEAVSMGDLPSDWRAYPAPIRLAAIGERWLQESRTAVLSVPSAVIPHERNFVLNPAHADFATIAIGNPEPFTFDPRMWKR
jgi:RES domain-containing protein